MKKSTIAFSILMVSSAIAFSQERQLVKKWETDTLLKVPESVLYDANDKVLYVTNIDGQPWEKDGKGSVGKVGLDGKIIAVDWVSGLSAPKGMAMHKNKLYVADFDRVVVIDTKKGTIAETIIVEGAQGLNDISIDKKGVIYVSDSRAKKLLRIENGKSAVYLDQLKGPNGVLVQGDDLYILDAGSLYKVEKDKSLKKLAEGMEGGTDGVEQVAANEFIVSCWGGMMYYVYANGSTHNMLDTRELKMNTADIGYDAKNRIVYVPTFWKNKIVAYELK
jgi:DNA-binding beta-propeller fold protein YncE